MSVMNRWHVCQDEDTKEWIAASLNLLEVFTGLDKPDYRIFPTWREAYDYAYQRVKDNTELSTWTDPRYYRRCDNCQGFGVIVTRNSSAKECSECNGEGRI